jgi:hypothetical protein
MAVSAAIVAVAVYVIYMDRGNEARNRILMLEAAIQEKDQADAQRRLVEQREREQQAQAAQEKSRLEDAAKRDAAERGVTLRVPDNPRVAEKKNVEETKRPAPQPVRARQSRSLGAGRPLRRPWRSANRTTNRTHHPRRRVPAPTAGRRPFHGTGKPAAARTPTEQLADADRATEAKRFSEPLAIIRPLADAGNAHAQTRMGDAYMEGRGVPRDDAAAGRWYEDAALKGETGAQVKLATMYAKGKGVLPNYNLAYIWFGTSAPRGQFGQGGAGADREPSAAHRTGAGRQAHREPCCAHGEVVRGEPWK